MYALMLALIPAAPPDIGAVPFAVTSAADNRPVGKLLRLDSEFAATITTRLGDVTVKDVVSLRRENRSLPAFPTKPHLVTTMGDRIVGDLLGGGESLRFAPSILRLKAGDAWLVPLSNAAAVWLTDTPADTPTDANRYAWTDGNKNRDVFRFRNGDTARGILVNLRDEGRNLELEFKPDGRDEARTVGAKELTAITFNPALARSRKPKGPFAHVVLTDGSRLDVTTPTIAAGILKGETLFGQKVELPLDCVVSLDVFQGKAVYLSDLKPKKVEQAGFLGVAWPWAADRTVHGAQLRLTLPAGETAFDKGLGTHPKTVLTYDLAAKYRRFEAVVGLDPDGGVHGRAVVRVLVDGKEQPIAGLAMLAAGNAVAVRVDVSGAKELVLEVGFGPAGGVGADVNWADARLVE